MKRILCAIAIGAFSAAAGAQPQYQALVLPSLYGTYDEARAINNLGQVTGISATPGFATQTAFFYSGGALQDLGTLGGAYSVAQRINDSGHVVGFSSTAGEAAQRAFLYDGVLPLQDLGTLGGLYSYGQDINNAGQVVGYSFNATDPWERAFLYSGGVMHDIGTLGSSAVAFGVNESGQIAGSSNTLPFGAGAQYHAFRYSGGTMQDLGTLGGDNSFSNAINDNGDVVGSSNLAGNPNHHAFLYAGGAMHNLGTLGGISSVAWDINNAGAVVGFAFNAEGNGRAFLYRDGVMRDVNDLIDPASGLIVDFAYGINDAGQIVGRAYENSSGAFRAVLLNPVAVVPEPGTYALLLAGLGLVFLRRATKVAKASPASSIA